MDLPHRAERRRLVLQEKFRAKNQTISIKENEAAIEPPAVSEKEARLLLLEKFIGELKELDKALMVLYLDGKNHQEIAEILGISTTNVSSKVGRIKDKLKEKFSNYEKRVL